MTMSDIAVVILIVKMRKGYLHCLPKVIIWDWTSSLIGTLWFLIFVILTPGFTFVV